MLFAKINYMSYRYFICYLIKDSIQLISTLTKTHNTNLNLAKIKIILKLVASNTSATTFKNNAIENNTPKAKHEELPSSVTHYLRPLTPTTQFKTNSSSSTVYPKSNTFSCVNSIQIPNSSYLNKSPLPISTGPP